MAGSLPTRSHRLKGVLLGTVALGLASPGLAAEPSDLERKLEQLLQEVEALKRSQEEQRQYMEEQQRKLEAQEQLLETQRDQIQAQDERIDQQEEAVLAAPAQAVTAGEHPGSFRIPGSNTSVKIGGYVKGDLFYDINSDTGDSFASSAIPADGTDEKEGSFRSHSRQTRINLTTWTPVEDLGEVRTFIEGDFFGGGGNEVFSNSTSFRIRHAFGEFTTDGFSALFGQTWTNFMPLTSYPETIDFFGPIGIPFVRQGQARFTYRGFDNWALSGSVENSELTGRDGTIESGTTIGSESSGDVQFGIDTIPDFTAAAEYDRDGWNFKVAGLARLLATESGGGAPQDDEQFGWGAFLGGVVPIGNYVPFLGDDSIQANFTYGNGVGRYMLGGFGQDARVDDDGEVDAIESWGFAGSYTHHWSDTFRSNAVYGHWTVDGDDRLGDDDTARLQTVHANLIWSPTDRVNIGIEWIYGLRTFQESDLDNTAQRVQFAAQYLF